MSEPAIKMALDKSVRTIDQDGHLHVSLTPISKANVCGYMGREIPDFDKIGLEPNRVYQLLRHPDELKKAASTWSGKPLLSKHVPQSADDHQHEIVVGAVGNEIVFKAPYLMAPLSVWDGDAIKLINSGEQRELSSAYRYEYDPTPGTYDGVRYDGIMRNLKANHVSLVEQGRAGPDVMVGDSALPLITIPDPTPATTPEVVPDISIETDKEPTLMATRQAATPMSRQALYASGAIRAYLMPKMASDAKLDLNPILKPVTAKNWKASKPKIKVALDKALAGKMAEDATIEDVIDMLDQLETMADEDVEANVPAETAVDADPDDDDEETKKKKAKEAAEKLKEAAAEDEDDDGEDEDDDEEDKKRKAKEAAEKLKEAAKDRKGARDRKAMDVNAEPKVTKTAMDAAINAAVRAATRTAEINTITRLRAIADAERIVRPYVGELAIAQDSAEAVFKIALDAADVDLDGVPPAAYAAMVKMLPMPGEVKPVKQARIAQDAAAMNDMAKRFPGVAALKTR